MKYTTRVSYVEVIGGIWWPMGAVCAQRYPLSGYDIANMTDDDGKVTRESVELWLGSHSGDFSEVTDFSASVEMADDTTVDIPWASEESELTYNDATFGSED